MIIRTSTLRLSRSNRFRTRKSDNVQIGGSVGAARVVGCGVGSGSLRAAIVPLTIATAVAPI